MNTKNLLAAIAATLRAQWGKRTIEECILQGIAIYEATMDVLAEANTRGIDVALPDADPELVQAVLREITA